MAVVSGKKTVADCIREMDQAGYKEEGIFMLMQNHYMPVWKEPDSIFASLLPKIYVDLYEGESPYFQPCVISQESETIMDEEVPPTVQQEPIDDDYYIYFFNFKLNKIANIFLIIDFSVKIDSKIMNLFT
ncbi:MAG: hypothetical protein Q8755_02975 [Candidatus Phytoplasma australasiaticum]|nr:hypothetical protein [Candidatus Phytoplasma australasiaticum]